MIFANWERNGIEVCCRAIDAVEYPASDFAEWLSHREIKRLGVMTSLKRRKTWLAGRVVAKTMAHGYFSQAALCDIELISANASGQGISPYLECEGRRCPLVFSLSHTDREIAVAMTHDDKWTLGIDLVDLHDAGDRFASIRNRWLTPSEKVQVSPFDSREIARRWALKEAAYKSMGHVQTGFSPLHNEVLRDETRQDAWRITCLGETVIAHDEITVIESRDSILAIVCYQARQETQNFVPALS